jgi:chromate reductase, NAD(P)H dehydrogenase (quinone)
MNTKPRVLVFAGSIRSGSLNRKLARAAAAALERQGLPVTLADLRDYPMPIYDGDLEASAGLPQPAKAFKELLRSHDALAMASPEYNGSFPALLKNAIDWATRAEPGEPRLAAFQGKKVILMSASPSQYGGQRGLRHLRQLLEMIHLEVLPAQLTVGNATAAFDAEGKVVRPEDRAALDRLAEDLAHALEAGTPAAA